MLWWHFPVQRQTVVFEGYCWTSCWQYWWSRPRQQSNVELFDLKPETMEMQATLASARDIGWDFLILGMQETLAKQTTIWSHQQVHAKPVQHSLVLDASSCSSPGISLPRICQRSLLSNLCPWQSASTRRMMTYMYSWSTPSQEGTVLSGSSASWAVTWEGITSYTSTTIRSVLSNWL